MALDPFEGRHMTTKKITVRRSKIHGRGFFVARPVKKGAVIAALQGKICKKVNKNIKDVLGHPDWVGIGKNTWLDPRPPFKFINHSCAPSAGIRGKTTMFAERNLKAGDEVTLDYSTIEGDPRWHMRCFCKSKNCRKTIRSIRFLPYTTYKKYLPYIPGYFQSLYKKGIRKGKPV